MGLEEYKRKRRFNETPEPEGSIDKAARNTFVIQKHRATRLHYDFRLEMDGVLRSWAVPKGPSLDPAEKRLAVETEDHPIDYGGFEGVIPKGNYGAGNVIIWDNGTYEMVDPDTPEKGWRKGKLHFVLKGRKLKGEWVLVRGSRDPKQWIFFKVRDEHANPDKDITEERPESILSGKLVEDVDKPAKSSKKKTSDETRHWYTPVERELERFGMKAPGRVALPRNIQPMLATLVDKPFNGDEWLFELKLDGIRAVIVKNGSTLEMWTRNGKSMTNRFPTLAAALREMLADSMIIDGEIVAMDEKGHSHFSTIQPRIHLSRARDIAEADQKIPVHLYVFDVMYLNGYDLTRFPLIERKTVLRQLLPDGGWIRYTDHIEDRGVDFFREVAKLRLEGIVAKMKKSPYQQSRSRYWLKIKTQQTDHFVIGGFTAPEGSRKFFGALLLGLYNQKGELIYVGRAGGGFDDDALSEIHQELQSRIVHKAPFKEVPAEVRRSTWVNPPLVCEVRFDSWTPDRKLRAPIFQGLRNDVDPGQCILEESMPAEPEVAAPPRPNGGATAARSIGISTRAELTNLEKVYWPEDGLTKGDLIRYYDRISAYILPHLLDRPLVFKRYPNGIHGQHFYQKDAHDYIPDWIRTEEMWSPDVERSIRYFIGADRDQLLYIANMGAITQNPWSSRLQFIERPDYVIFDLDPVEASYDAVQKVALELKRVLDELSLRGYPKTSGASGIHVYLPIPENTFTYEDVRIFAEAVASIVVARAPELATIQRVVRKRTKGTIYVDYLQNVKGKTVASVYSPRAEIGAPVSAPLKWSEFKKPLNPKDYTMETIFKRLDRFGDLFQPVLTDRQDIAPFLNVLKSRGARSLKSEPEEIH